MTIVPTIAQNAAIKTPNPFTNFNKKITNLGDLGFYQPATHFNFYDFGTMRANQMDGIGNLDLYHFDTTNLAEVKIDIHPFAYDRGANYAGIFSYSVYSGSYSETVVFSWDGGLFNNYLNSWPTISYMMPGIDQANQLPNFKFIHENFSNYQSIIPVEANGDIYIQVSGILFNDVSQPMNPMPDDLTYVVDITPRTGRTPPTEPDIEPDPTPTPTPTPPKTTSCDTTHNDYVYFNQLTDQNFDGGAGIDTVSFANMGWILGSRSIWNIEAKYGVPVVQNYHHFYNVERFEFADTSLAFDLNGNAKAAALILGAVFGASYVHNKEFVGTALALLDNCMSYSDLITIALSTPEYAKLAGNTSNQSFVNQIYKNVMGTAPTPYELYYYVDLLNSGEQTQTSLALLAAQLPQNAINIDLIGLESSGLEYTPINL